MTFDHDDLLPLVDETGKVTGKELYTAAHEKRLLHLCVSIFAMRKNGKFILQFRSKFVGYPHTIDTTASGHVTDDQTPFEAALIELEEEMGIKGAKLTEIGHAIEPCKNAKPVHFTYFYFTKWNKTVKPDPHEVEKVLEMTLEELDKKLIEEPEKFAPGLEVGLPLLKKYLSTFS